MTYHRLLLAAVAALSLVTFTAPSRASAPQRVTDLAMGPASAFPSWPLAFGDDLVFAASTGTSAAELFRSDGTAAGTVPLTSLGSIAPSDAPAPVFAVGARVCFGAKGGLWASDGTPAGTALIVPGLRPDIIEATSNTSARRATLGAKTYFMGAKGSSYGLWRTDGTADGTERVTTSYGVLMGELGGRVLYTGSGWLSSVENTPTGSTQIAQVTNAFPVAVMNGRLFFTQFLGQTKFELWKTDGTSSGTMRVANLPYSPGTTSDVRPSPRGAFVAGDQLYIVYQGLANERFVVRSDGTEAGSVKLGMTFPSERAGGTASGRVVLDLADPAKGFEPFVASAADASPSLLADLAPGSASSAPGDFTAWNGRLAFVARTPDLTLMTTDGVGTLSLGTLAPADKAGATILGVTPRGLFATGYDDGHGYELWFAPGPSSPTNDAGAEGEGGDTPGLAGTPPSAPPEDAPAAAPAASSEAGCAVGVSRVGGILPGVTLAAVAAGLLRSRRRRARRGR